MPLAFRPLALLLTLLALGACASPAPPGSAPSTLAPLERGQTRAGLELIADVFSAVDQQYVVAPSFAAVRLGALRGLEKALPEGSLRVDVEGDVTVLTYAGPSGALETTRLGGASRDDALRDVGDAYRIAGRIAPSVAATTLEYALVRGAVGALDPYSTFLDPESYREMQVETSGSFGGLGVEITMRDERLTVVAPIEGTPAWRAGLQPGDRIVEIEGISTSAMSLVDAVKRLRGLKGTAVRIRIQREGLAQALDLSVTREIIQVQSVTVRELEPGLGYVRIRQLQERTPRDLEEGLRRLENAGRVAGLVVDLRNNPGGLLSSAVEVSGQFLADGTLVVYTEARLQNQNMRFVAHSPSPRTRVPLVLLVNQGTASGSEIVAAALQDHGRGVVMGQRSFGKGSVQTIVPLRDGSALRLTTAHYFTPKGRSIHGTGIAPDVMVEAPKDDAASPPIALLSETERQKRDVQLQRAIDRVRALAGLPAPPAAAAAPPLQLVVSAPTDQARVDQETIALAGLASGSGGIRRVVVAVNGHEVSRQEEATPPPSVTLNLPLSLREGQNTIAVTVTGADGTTRQEVRAVRFERPQPVAAATPSIPMVRDRWAVVIGVGRYDSRAITPLRYTVPDAEAIHRSLLDAGFAKDHVVLLTDKTEQKPSLRNIKWALGTFLARAAKKDDTVVIYFAGHGAPEVDPRGLERDGLAKYLIPADADPEDLYATAFPMDELQTIFGRLEAERVVMFLDTCYSGAAGGRTFASRRTRSGTLDDLFLERLTRSKGRAIITASRPSEVSLELPELGHGLFTFYLVEGLKGAGDLNRDGIVSLHELYEYLEQQVTQKSRAVGGNQHPVMKGELEGVLPLVRLGR